MIKQLLIFFILLITLGLRIIQVGALEKPKVSLEDEAKGVRTSLSKQVAGILPYPQSALLSGILIGVQSQLPKDLTDNLRKTSTIHIVVVSGENLTLVAGFVLWLIPWFGRKKTLGLASIMVLGYSWLTGFQVPVLRAALMVLLGFLAQILGREKESPWILILTAWAMLVYNPDWILSISFQLSFMATLAVLVLAPALINRFKAIPEIIRQDLGVALSVQILIWPILASNFHQISLVGIFANILILWTVSLIMLSGALALILSFSSVVLGQIISIFPSVLLTYLIYIVNFFGNLSFASLGFEKASPLFWIGYYILVGGLFMLLFNYVREDNKRGFGKGSEKIEPSKS